MKLYATISPSRKARVAKKGDDERLIIELSAFNKVLGEIMLEVLGDGENKPSQYLLTYLPNEEGSEAIIIEEGHREQGILQRAKA